MLELPQSINGNCAFALSNCVQGEINTRTNATSANHRNAEMDELMPESKHFALHSSRVQCDINFVARAASISVFLNR